jgi:hypothetical protein
MINHKTIRGSLLSATCELSEPSKMAGGAEPQLDAAVKQMLYELKARPFVKPRKPAVSRDRRGGPIPQSEK